MTISQIAFVIYIFVACLLSFTGVAYNYCSNKHYPNFYMIIALLMLAFSPLYGKLIRFC